MYFVIKTNNETSCFIISFDDVKLTTAYMCSLTKYTKFQRVVVGGLFYTLAFF